MPVREVPTLSIGHPQDSVDALAAALGVTGADARYSFETSLLKFNADQLRVLTHAVAKRPFDVSPQMAYQRALAQIAPPVVPPAPAV